LSSLVCTEEALSRVIRSASRRGISRGTAGRCWPAVPRSPTGTSWLSSSRLDRRTHRTCTGCRRARWHCESFWMPRHDEAASWAPGGDLCCRMHTESTVRSIQRIFICTFRGPRASWPELSSAAWPSPSPPRGRWVHHPARRTPRAPPRLAQPLSLGPLRRSIGGRRRHLSLAQRCLLEPPPPPCQRAQELRPLLHPALRAQAQGQQHLRPRSPLPLLIIRPCTRAPDRAGRRQAPRPPPAPPRPGPLAPHSDDE
jgi:hypothetical protein